MCGKGYKRHQTPFQKESKRIIYTQGKQYLIKTIFNVKAFLFKMYLVFLTTENEKNCYQEKLYQSKNFTCYLIQSHFLRTIKELIYLFLEGSYAHHYTTNIQQFIFS